MRTPIKKKKRKKNQRLMPSRASKETALQVLSFLINIIGMFENAEPQKPATEAPKTQPGGLFQSNTEAPKSSGGGLF